jgi:hypothetical protein
MDGAYRSVYADLYSRFPERLSPELRQYAHHVQHAIERAQEQLEKEDAPFLREDGKYFLLINYVEMIGHPLRYPAAPELDVNADELESIMRHDIEVIIRESSSRVRGVPRPGPTVSAHAVFNTITTVWEKLRAGATKLWEGPQKEPLEGVRVFVPEGEGEGGGGALASY